MPMPGAIPTGMLAKRPIKKLPRAEMAAVAVIISRRISLLQRAYAWSATQVGSIERSQVQVPPVSETMLALTAMMYLDKTDGA